ncbi:UDP-glucuronosyltransferase 2C1 [Holothuria leucospilota]|uniref:UDP-glucuronosyltransferase 2C1 n=1 Tax=Holothuria leucospilota TaxID=206669 RepID=A0A9Q1BNW5_HOLLE|nr:UDP-glucuronosyltransferase 2C1 [Holothuria leucospilota]
MELGKSIKLSTLSMTVFGFSLILSNVKMISGGNILLVSTNSMASPSHYMALSTLTGGLVSRKHNVTIVTNDIKGLTGFPNGTYSQALYFEASYDPKEVAKVMDEMTQVLVFSPMGFIETMMKFTNFMKEMYNSCLDLWKDHKLLENLRTSHFDLVLVFPLSACDVLMSHYLDVPFVVILPSIRVPIFHEGFIGMPLPASFVPFDMFGTMTDEMNFWERLRNLASPLVAHIMGYQMTKDYYNIQVMHDIYPDRTIRELYSKASLFLSHVSFGNDFPRPYTPNFVPIGGLVSQASKPLPKDMEEFVQGSGDSGVIIFTLGSAVKGLFKEEIAEIFARVFSKLPQRVMWRHDAKPPSSLAENTKIFKWLPQNDLLGHPKTRLLIYHGGSNGVLESICHGVPMVIIPLLGDQVTHAARVQKKGMGLMLDKGNITEENLLSTIQEVLQNPMYRERAQHYSDIHHDLPMTPLERAVYWIEHVMKFGDQHLRPRSADMDFIELYMIDVIVFLIFVFSVGLYIDYLILRKCFECCCGKFKRTKSKRE